MLIVTGWLTDAALVSHVVLPLDKVLDNEGDGNGNVVLLASFNSPFLLKTGTDDGDKKGDDKEFIYGNVSAALELSQL